MVKKFVVLLMILKICCGRMNHLRLEQNDDIIKLITHAGYKAEAYVVTTDDGYFLKIHRLLPKLRTNKKPVFLMHGIVATAADFLITGPKVALAYLLADNGYDVWLGNARGSKHSMLHRNFTADSKNFYNFSWHEIGYYDLPAMIDFMLQKTRSPNAFYVAHSQGTTSLLVLLSTRPEYNNKIIQAHLMAPASFCSHSPHPLVRPFGLSMKFGLFKDNHYLDLADIWTFLKFLTKFYCKEKTTPSIESCEGAVLALSLFFGANENEIEIDTVSINEELKHSIDYDCIYFRECLTNLFRMFHQELAKCNLSIISSCSSAEDSGILIMIT